MEKGELATSEFASAAEGGPQESFGCWPNSTTAGRIGHRAKRFRRLTAIRKASSPWMRFPIEVGWTDREISREANRQKATVQVKVQSRIWTRTFGRT